MNSHPQDSAPGASPPPQPAASGPQPYVIAATRSPSRKARFAVLALVLGAVAGALWLGLKELLARHEDQAADTAHRAGAARASADECRTGPLASLVDLAPLRGEGLTVAEFIALIEKAAAQPVQCEVLNTPLGALRFSAYDGVLLVPVWDALGMLRYAGLAVELPQKDGPINVHPLNSRERMLELLTAGADPDGPDWGALRPWRSFRVSSALSVEALAASAEAAPEPGLVAALAWALPGLQHIVSVADDGRIRQEYSGVPSPAELQAAEKSFVKLACVSGATASPAARAAAVAGLGELLRLSSLAQLPEVSPVVRALGVLLRDKDAEVSRSAALAAGNSAAVALLARLVERLLEKGDSGQSPGQGAWQEQRIAGGLALSPCLLAALTHAESLGRRLDRESLGAGNWERRRVLFQQVSSWLAGPPQSQPGDIHDTGAPQASVTQPNPVAQQRSLSATESQSAAWLQAAAVFCPGADLAVRTKEVEERLWKSGNTQAQLVVLSVDRIGGRLAAPDLPAPLRLAVAAGPLYMHSSFPLQQAADWLQAKDMRFVQAGLWRLSRVEQGDKGFVLSDTENAALVSILMAFVKNNPSPILRRLAVEALYRERQLKNPDSVWEKYRLCWDTRSALRAFLDDKDGAVQAAAAGAVGPLSDPTELSEVAGPGLRDRAPEAVARLLEPLGDRLLKSTGQTEELTQAIVAVCGQCLDFGNDSVERQAGSVRMKDPEMSLEAKVRLLGSFKKAPARAGGIRALGMSGGRGDWTSRLVSHLLADGSPEVRAAVFQSRLPARIETGPKEEGLKLWLQGLRDTEPPVRLAALKALGQALAQTQVKAVAQCIRELAANDPDAEVKACAAALLRPTQDKPAPESQNPRMEKNK